jgi:hypothetical protein
VSLAILQRASFRERLDVLFPNAYSRRGRRIEMGGRSHEISVALTDWQGTPGCIAMESEQQLEALAAFASDDRPMVEIRP